MRALWSPGLAIPGRLLVVLGLHADGMAVGWTDAMTEPTQSSVAGKTVERMAMDEFDALRLYFTDGSMLYANGVWLNTGEASTEVALLSPDDPKSYDESHDFYDVMRERLIGGWGA